MGDRLKGRRRPAGVGCGVGLPGPGKAQPAGFTAKYARALRRAHEPVLSGVPRPEIPNGTIYPDVALSKVTL